MRLPISILVLALAVPAAAARGNGVAPLRLSVAPNDPLIDRPVAIRVQANAGDTVSLRLTTQRFGMTFESQATYVVPSSGTVDTARVTPQAGSYSGRHAMGLFWSVMPRAGGEHGHSEFRRGSEVEPRPYTIVATDGTQTTRISGTRFVLAADVRRGVVDSGSLVATVFAPIAGCRRGVIVLGGSEGGVPEEQAAVLAGHGFSTLALAYFQAPGLPDSLEDIPLETVQRALSFMHNNRAACADKRIALVGSSKGAELALVFASMFPEIGAVVAIAPSSVVFSGLGNGSGPTTSSWSYRAKSLPFVNEDVPQSISDAISAQRTVKQKVSYLDWYLARVQRNTNAAAVIPVERIRGPVMLIAGADDKLWPSTYMARQVMTRLKSHGHRYQDRMSIYPAAGHSLGVPFDFVKATLAHASLDLGGSGEATESADEDCWPRLIAFLRSAA